MVKDVDAAWAAGLWEGEGCFSCHRNSRGRVQTQALISSTDEDVILKFQRIIGYGSIRERIPKPGQTAKKPYWVWQITSRKDFKNLVLTLWPHLCERRRARAMEIIELADKTVFYAKYEPR